MYDFYMKAERNGIYGSLLEARIRSLGWNKERAMTEPPKKKKPPIPKKFVRIAEENGIGYNTLRDQVHYRGWSYEKAATAPKEDRKKKADFARKFCRKYPDEILEQVRINGIKYDTFRNRVASGWDMYEAATRPTMTRREIGLLTKEKRQIRSLRQA